MPLTVSVSSVMPFLTVMLVAPDLDTPQTPRPSPTGKPVLPLICTPFAPPDPALELIDRIRNDPLGALGPGVLSSNSPIGCMLSCGTSMDVTLQNMAKDVDVLCAPPTPFHVDCERPASVIGLTPLRP